MKKFSLGRKFKYVIKKRSASLRKKDTKPITIRREEEVNKLINFRFANKKKTPKRELTINRMQRLIAF
jgi:hypothetical protein